LPTYVTCPTCHARFRLTRPVPQGRKARCRKCGAIFNPVPARSQSDAVSAETLAYIPPETKPGEKSGAGADDHTGRVIGGCRIEAKLGEGGMGVVYKARHLALDIPVALKLLSPDVAHQAADSTWGDRFLREARAAAKLQHQNIVGVLNVGREGDLHFIVMQFVDGESLRERLSRDGVIPVRESIAIIKQVCDALAVAHKNHIIHRDIKPDNIMIDSHGVIKLADLGLARNIAEDKSITVSGVSMGTPYYMAPEQAANAKNADQRSDIYSLGCTWYHMITGVVPYEGDSGFTVLMKHANDPVPDPRAANPQIPPAIAALIRRMMAKKPENRYQNIAELQADIERVETGGRPAEPMPPPQPEHAYPALSPKKSNLGWFVAGACAAILLVVVLAAAARRIYRRRGPVANQTPPTRSAAPQATPAQTGSIRMADWRLSTIGPAGARDLYPLDRTEHSFQNGILTIRNTLGKPRAVIFYYAAPLSGDFTVRLEFQKVPACGIVSPQGRAEPLRLLLPKAMPSDEKKHAWRKLVVQRKGGNLKCLLDGKPLPQTAIRGDREVNGYLWLSIGAEKPSRIRACDVSVHAQPSPPARRPRPQDLRDLRRRLELRKRISKEVFRRLDDNLDGKLSQAELRKHDRRYLMLADTNGDGEITRDEWDSLLRRLRRIRPIPQ